jgi:hypothetical protein
MREGAAGVDGEGVDGVGADGVMADGVGVDAVGGGATQKATVAAEEGETTQTVAVETMESKEHQPDLAPGETTRRPAPEQRDKARRENPHLHLDHHVPSSRGVLLSAPMADVSPPPRTQDRAAASPCCMGSSPSASR